MKKPKLKDKSWYSLAVAICIGVLFWFVLTNLGTVWAAICKIGSYIYPLVAGTILAYLINPLLRLFQFRVLKRIENEKVRKTLALVLAFAVVFIFLILLIGMLLPQLFDSIKTLYGNLDTYIAALSSWISSLGAGALAGRLEGLLESSQSVLDRLSGFLSANSDTILATVSKAGGHISAWAIGMIFSIYFLAEKEKIRAGGARLMHRMFKSDGQYGDVVTHLTKMDEILTRYIIFSIIDGLIVGIVNAIFMAIAGMSYGGLVSVIVGVTNLIPTFGPIIGAVIGAFILLLTKPVHALYFLIFTVILQTIDGYILKPKMFGETFGVSGLWILIAIIVGGRIFGVVGIVLAIPFVAIADYVIKEIVPTLHENREKRIAARRNEDDDIFSEE